VFDDGVYATRIERIEPFQPHPVPKMAMNRKGPFPAELYNDPEIIFSSTPAAESGSDYSPGATAQNKFQEPRQLICSSCHARVYEHKTGDHVCEQ